MICNLPQHFFLCFGSHDTIAIKALV